MREALLKLVRMALRDGYLSDNLLELIRITESNMTCPYCGESKPCNCPGSPKTRDSGKEKGD